MTLVGITGFKPDVWAVDRLEVGSIPTPSRHRYGCSIKENDEIRNFCKSIRL